MRDRRADKGTNANPQIHQQRSATAWTTRLATASATLASVLAASQDAKAAVIQVSGRPVSLTAAFLTTGSAPWDIDGDGMNDFRLEKVGGGGYIYLQSNGLSGKGIIGNITPSPAASRLYSGDVVGPAQIFAPANQPGQFGAIGLSALGTFSSRTAIGAGFSDGGFVAGQNNYFGFSFDSNLNTYYGFGIIDFDLAARTVTISSWAYESVAGDPITVGPIDADAVPGPIGLAGLAAGAAWTRKLRRRIRQSTEAS